MWRACAVSLFLLLAAATQTASPVERVIKLLNKLRDQITEEGQEEAVTYDKYSCFCKEESDRKVYAIKKSDKRIEELDAAIQELSSQITALDQKSTQLEGDIKTKADEINATQVARKSAYDVYVGKRKLLVDAIDVVTRAITELKASKDGVSTVSATLLEMRSAVARLPDTLSLSAVRSLQAPKAYNYSSLDIIATLQGLSVTFKKSLADLDMNEGEEKHASDMDVGAKMNTKKSMEAEKDASETESAAKTESMNEKQGLKDQETKERDADQAFLDDMTTKCEAKATAWDARSKTRADEITALTDAMAKLKNASEVYSVNTKLVGLISKRTDATVKPHRTAKVSPPMLFQVRRTRLHSVENKKVRSLAARLSQEAQQLRSAPLAMLAVQLVNSTGGDHFVQVRGIIKDLIAKLEAEAIAEANTKGTCDTAMKAAIDSRDTAKQTIESKEALVDTTEAEIKQLTADKIEQAEKIADGEKFKKEMTDLRALEKAQNEKALADAKAGVADLDAALNLLQGVYTSLVQQTPVDRYNQTFGDKAPETFSGTYEGKVDASKGVIGILEVIKSDFQRTADTIEAAEKAAQDQFDESIKDTEATISAATTEKGKIESSLTGKESDLTTAKDDLKSAKTTHELAIEELEKLTATCIAGEESYKERTEHRQKEIAALKEALQILIDWKGL